MCVAQRFTSVITTLFWFHFLHFPANIRKRVSFLPAGRRGDGQLTLPLSASYQLGEAALCLCFRPEAGEAQTTVVL